MCKYCINPDNTEDAGTQDNDDGRRDAFSDTSGCGDAAVHKAAECIAEPHDTDSLHTGINHCRFRSKQRKKLRAKYKEQSAQDCAGDESICKTDSIRFQHSFFILGTPVLTDKTCTCSIKSKHNVINQGISICSSCISGNHHCVKRVDASLHKQVCNGKDSVLKTGRDTKHENCFARLGVQADFSHESSELTHWIRLR